MTSNQKKHHRPLLRTLTPHLMAQQSSYLRSKLLLVLVVSLLVSLVTSSSSTTEVHISNVAPRLDVEGNIMDIHDGNTWYWNGTYFYYGASYGDCLEPQGSNGCADLAVGNCGFRLDHNVSLYTSSDLVSWTFQGHIFEMQRDNPIPGILFCPKVIYNAMTNLYLLWFNWLPDPQGTTNPFATSLYAVAASPSPYGPFKVVNQNVSTLAFTNTGDFGLFLDDNGEGYLIYTSHITGYLLTHRMSVERLAPDFQSTLGAASNSGFFGEVFVEAPAMFKRNGIYYTLFGRCCCYCQEGAPVTFYTSSSPLGPYKVGRSLGDDLPAQQTFVLSYNQGMNDTWAYLWQGDRWQSAPDGIKGHDFSYWGPLNFDDQGDIAPLPFLPSFNLQV